MSNDEYYYAGEGLWVRVRTATPEQIRRCNQTLAATWLGTPSGELWVEQQIDEIESYLATEADA